MHYYNARYYDDHLGQFISPDTIVPDATSVLDYNRFMMVRGNPLKYTDSSGHCIDVISTWLCIGAVLAGAALLLQGDDTAHQPTQADINSQRLGGSLIIAGGTGLFASELLGASTSAACADGDCTNEVNAVTNTASSAQKVTNTAQNIWQMKPFDRGVAIENLLGRSPQLVNNFPVIDRFQGGVATSIKSIDLGAKTYQNTSNLAYTIKGYVDTLAQWQGQQSAWGGVVINPSQVTSRVVELAIPTGATQAQMNVLQQVQQYAPQVGVQLNIITIP